MSAGLVLSPPEPKRELPQAEWVRLTPDEFSEMYISEHKNEFAVESPLLCTCPQRDFPHELSVHENLWREAFNPELKKFWPWSLMLSPRVELSTERKAA